MRSIEKEENEDDRDVSLLLQSMSCWLPFDLITHTLVQPDKQDCHTSLSM